MIKRAIKAPARIIRNVFLDSFVKDKTKARFYRMVNDQSFSDFDILKTDIRRFVNSMQADEIGIEYRYSGSCQIATLYASAYACMTLSLLGDLANIPEEKRNAWIAFFNSFQRESDGLFYDIEIKSPLFDDGDWWGARHLTLHMISAYSDLGARPKHPFKFLYYYYEKSNILNWLDAFDWNQAFSHSNDIDNKILNIGCLLQYQRDFWNDENAGQAIKFIQLYLQERINYETGMWGSFDVNDPNQRSRMVQFAYHLFLIFFYDNIPLRHIDKIVTFVLKTQNELGGFGVKVNSSACEDIDSIDILIRIAPQAPEFREKIERALHRAFRWILCNRVDDGGFVFRLYEPMVYGHEKLASKKNDGAMLPTWFRTLSLAYLSEYFDLAARFHITNCPGYEFTKR